MNTTLKIGVDIGSTTIKMVILDNKFSRYIKDIYQI